MDTRIFVMTHKKIEPLPYEGYELLQLGTALNGDLGYIRDDTGDNISAKNPNYCELTGIYWLWKNIKCDNIGVVHYRRFFYKEDGDILTAEDAEKLLGEYDAIVPSCGFGDTRESGGYPDTLYQHYARHHFIKDLDLCRTVIQEKYPGYLPAFDSAVKNGYLINFANIWITRKELFDSYCQWLFDILFEVEKRTDISEYDSYQARIYGFLSERLFKVWLLMQPIRAIEQEGRQIDYTDVIADAKENDLISRLITLKLAPLFSFYDSTPSASLILPQDPEDDFDGKTPVWFCFWQGEKAMTDTARLCYSSLVKNLPADRTALRFICEENVTCYASFTEGIIARYNDGRITPAHMMDMLRAELLYRYGGMWIDPGCFVSRPISPELFDSDIFTLRYPPKTVWSRDIAGGLWDSALWIAKPGLSFFKNLTEALWFYFELGEDRTPELIGDHIIRILCDRFPEHRALLESIPVTGADRFYLEEKAEKPVRKRHTDHLKSAGTFYRLNAHREYRRKVITEEETLYGWLMGQYG